MSFGALSGLHGDEEHDSQEVWMRKIILFMVVTLDGYYEGPNQEFDWPNVDEEFNEFALQQLDEVDTLLFGRATYEGMASYWPTPQAQQDDPQVTAVMNSIAKVVVSRTLDKAEWNNSRLIKDDVAEEIRRLKEQPGKDIAIFGSNKLTVSLLEMELIDELRILVNPIVLGAGHSLFTTAKERIKVKLVKTRAFASGNVLLCYEPVAR
jgi:dihydrofolate reductase